MISIVIPVYNEDHSLPELRLRLLEVSKEWNEEYEVILVDDGSTDSTNALCLEYVQLSPSWKCIALARNFGQQAAISAGLYYSRGDAVVVMDADLQDPPEVIAHLIGAWRDGFQVVYGIRRERKECLLKRLGYSMFYRLLARIAAVDIPRDAGDFCIMDREVVRALNRMPERTRFLRGMRSWVGFRQIGYPYERGERHSASSRYTLTKLFRLALDGIVSSSGAPLRLGIVLAGASATMLSAFVGIAALCFTLGWTFTPFLAPGMALWTCIGLLGLFTALQLLMIGLLGEYVFRIYEEVKNRPLWIAAKTYGIERADLSPMTNDDEFTPQRLHQSVIARAQLTGAHSTS